MPTDLRFEYQVLLGRYDIYLTDSATVQVTDATLQTGTAEIDQKIRAVLQTQRGEWYLDTTQGVPYFTDVFKKNASTQVVGSAITAALKRIPEVIEITEMSVTIDASARTSAVSFKARTTDGTFLVQEEF
jgi:hypothetical protein